MEERPLILGPTAARLRVYGCVLVSVRACIGCRIPDGLRIGLLRQGFELVDEVGIGRGIEILRLSGNAIDVFDFHLAQSKRRERCV